MLVGIVDRQIFWQITMMPGAIGIASGVLGVLGGSKSTGRDRSPASESDNATQSAQSEVLLFCPSWLYMTELLACAQVCQRALFGHFHAAGASCIGWLDSRPNTSTLVSRWMTADIGLTPDVAAVFGPFLEIHSGGLHCIAGRGQCFHQWIGLCRLRDVAVLRPTASLAATRPVAMASATTSLSLRSVADACSSVSWAPR